MRCYDKSPDTRTPRIARSFSAPSREALVRNGPSPASIPSSLLLIFSFGKHIEVVIVPSPDGREAGARLRISADMARVLTLSLRVHEAFEFLASYVAAFHQTRREREDLGLVPFQYPPGSRQRPRSKGLAGELHSHISRHDDATQRRLRRSWRRLSAPALFA